MFGSSATNPTLRQWFRVKQTADGIDYQGLQESIAHLQQLWSKDGGFDGIIGFSQGGCVGSLLIASGAPFDQVRFAVFISSFKSRVAAHQDLLKGLPVPTFHLIGLSDTMIAPERSFAFAECFESSTVVTHPGGHFTPSKWPVHQICEFVQERCADWTPPESMPAPPLTSLSLEERLGVLATHGHLDPSHRDIFSPTASEIVHALCDLHGSALVCAIEDLVEASCGWFRYGEGAVIGEEGSTASGAVLAELYVTHPGIMQQQLHTLAHTGYWDVLNELVLSTMLKYDPAVGSKVRDEVVQLYATQLRRDLQASAGTDISSCSRLAPRPNRRVNRVTNLARYTAYAIADLLLDPSNGLSVAEAKLSELIRNKSSADHIAAAESSLEHIRNQTTNKYSHALANLCRLSSEAGKRHLEQAVARREVQEALMVALLPLVLCKVIRMVADIRRVEVQIPRTNI